MILSDKTMSSEKGKKDSAPEKGKKVIVPENEKKQNEIESLIHQYVEQIKPDDLTKLIDFFPAQKSMSSDILTTTINDTINSMIKNPNMYKKYIQDLEAELVQNNTNDSNTDSQSLSSSTTSSEYSDVPPLEPCSDNEYDDMPPLVADNDTNINNISHLLKNSELIKSVHEKLMAKYTGMFATSAMGDAIAMINKINNVDCDDMTVLSTSNGKDDDDIEIVEESFGKVELKYPGNKNIKENNDDLPALVPIGMHASGKTVISKVLTQEESASDTEDEPYIPEEHGKGEKQSFSPNPMSFIETHEGNQSDNSDESYNSQDDDIENEDVSPYPLEDGSNTYPVHNTVPGINKPFKMKQPDITTNGIDASQIVNTFPSSVIQSMGIKTCDTCGKYFKQDMLAYLYDEHPICYHCIFFLHYDLNSRQVVDGVVGKKIVEYIIECQDDHECTKCSRQGNSCLICDHKLGIEIEGILNPELLYGNSKNTALDENDITPNNYYVEIEI